MRSPNLSIAAPRPKRALKPSARSTEALSTPKVTKKAARAAKAARRPAIVIRALVDATEEDIIEQEADALLTKEVEIQEVVKEAVQAQEPFAYAFQWRAMLDKKAIRSHGVKLQSDNGEEACQLIAQLSEELLHEECQYEEYGRRHVSCHFASLPEPRWWSTSLTTEGSGYEEALKQLADWKVEGRLGLTILSYTSVRLVSENTRAPRSSQRRLPIPPRPRDTATNRQLEAVQAERDELEVGGNWASEVTNRWTCTSKACSNHSKLCYWTRRNEAPNHVPIIKPILTAWSEGIRDGELTAVQPSPEMYGQMMQAKHEVTPRRRGAPQSQATHGGSNITFNMTPGGILAPSPTAGGIAASSPLRMPSQSPELSTIEQIDAFVQYCKSERCWRGEEDDLDEVKMALRANGDSIESMGRASIEDWRHVGLKMGYRSRLKKSAARWLAAGMPVLMVVV